LPSRNVGWTRNAFWKLIRRVQLLILYEFAQSFRALLIIIKLKKTKFGGTNGRADELVYIALIFRVEEQLSILAYMLLKLFFELNDMFENELIFGSIFSIGHWRIFLVFELSASFEFLIDDLLPSLEEFKKLVVNLSLHLNINKYLITSYKYSDSSVTFLF